MNALWLAMTAAAEGWASGTWATYRAWQRHGAQVRRGEKATPVLLWKERRRAADDTDADRPRLFAKAYSVFAAEQVDGAADLVAARAAQGRDTPELRMMDPNLQRNGGIYVSNEAFDDYQAERRELMEYIARHQISNVVVTSGHTHIYRASEIMPDFDDPTSPITAMEFVTGSLTADPDPRTIAPEDLLHVAEAIMLGANMPYLKQVDILNQGYAVVDLTPEETIVDFRVLDTFDPNATARTFARFRVVAGRPGIEILPPPAP